MNKTNRHVKYKASGRNNQLVLEANSEIFLPEDVPVQKTSAQLEELNDRKLNKAYSSRGRKSAADPRMLFKVMVYGYQCGIYSSRKLEALLSQKAEGIAFVKGTGQRKSEAQINPNDHIPREW